MALQVSCAFAPTNQTPDLIARAEQIGYQRAWVYDTPALQRRPLDDPRPGAADRRPQTALDRLDHTQLAPHHGDGGRPSER